MAEPWTAEVVVDADLARELVIAQFPDLAPAVVEPLGEGWDNTAFLVGEQWVFRFPRREVALPMNARELRVLPAIHGRVPLAVPFPERIGAASPRFPWPFAGHRLVPGRSVGSAALDDAQRAAAAIPLARFVAALHGTPARDVEAMGLPGDVIGKMDVASHRTRIRGTLEDLRDRGLLDDGAVRRIGRVVDDTPPVASRAPVLVHGDLYARHVLVDDAGLPSGVIDWGDAHAGDPAVDLSVAHHLLPPAAHAAFRDAYGGVDETTWARARFRAAVHAAATARYAHTIGDADLQRETTGALRRIAHGAAG